MLYRDAMMRGYATQPVLSDICIYVAQDSTGKSTIVLDDGKCIYRKDFLLLQPKVKVDICIAILIKFG